MAESWQLEYCGSVQRLILIEGRKLRGSGDWCYGRKSASVANWIAEDTSAHSRTAFSLLTCILGHPATYSFICCFHYLLASWPLAWVFRHRQLRTEGRHARPNPLRLAVPKWEIRWLGCMARGRAKTNTGWRQQFWNSGLSVCVFVCYQPQEEWKGRRRNATMFSCLYTIYCSPIEWDLHRPIHQRN